MCVHRVIQQFKEEVFWKEESDDFQAADSRVWLQTLVGTEGLLVRGFKC